MPEDSGSKYKSTAFNLCFLEMPENLSFLDQILFEFSQKNYRRVQFPPPPGPDRVE